MFGAVILALTGIVPFAVAIAGYLFSPLSWGLRVMSLLSAALLLSGSALGGGTAGWLARGVGIAAFGLLAAASWMARQRAS